MFLRIVFLITLHTNSKLYECQPKQVLALLNLEPQPRIKIAQNKICNKIHENLGNCATEKSLEKELDFLKKGVIKNYKKIFVEQVEKRETILKEILKLESNLMDFVTKNNQVKNNRNLIFIKEIKQIYEKIKTQTDLENIKNQKVEKCLNKVLN